MRPAKAMFLSGCESRPATIAPAGSNWSDRGSNEAVEAFSVAGSIVALNRVLVERFIAAQPPREPILDADAADVPLHGDQELSGFHGD